MLGDRGLIYFFVLST